MKFITNVNNGITLFARRRHGVFEIEEYPWKYG